MSTCYIIEKHDASSNEWIAIEATLDGQKANAIAALYGCDEDGNPFCRVKPLPLY
jgi:hypothetical protein